MKRVIAVGHAALDHVYRIAAFPIRPEKVRALEHIDSGGGMAANAAAAAAHLGAPTELWSRVGDDAAGTSVLDKLKSDGVDTAWVRILKNARTSTSAVIVDAQGEPGLRFGAAGTGIVATTGACGRPMSQSPPQ